MSGARSDLKIVCWLLLSTLVWAGPGAHAQQTLLKFARLIDGTGEVLQGREILVEDATIVATGDNLHSRYPQAEVIEHNDLVAMPGLIDVHSSLLSTAHA